MTRLRVTEESRGPLRSLAGRATLGVAEAETMAGHVSAVKERAEILG
ncbi:hypothetical protein ABIB51_001174 [Arthrobacter sp. UYCu712]